MPSPPNEAESVKRRCSVCRYVHCDYVLALPLNARRNNRKYFQCQPSGFTVLLPRHPFRGNCSCQSHSNLPRATIVACNLVVECLKNLLQLPRRRGRPDTAHYAPPAVGHGCTLVHSLMPIIRFYGRCPRGIRRANGYSPAIYPNIPTN